jgi:hypothetical protein
MLRRLAQTAGHSTHAITKAMTRNHMIAPGSFNLMPRIDVKKRVIDATDSLRENVAMGAGMGVMAPAWLLGGYSSGTAAVGVVGGMIGAAAGLVYTFPKTFFAATVGAIAYKAHKAKDVSHEEEVKSSNSL